LRTRVNSYELRSPEFQGVAESEGRSKSAIFGRDAVSYENPRIPANYVLRNISPFSRETKCRTKLAPVYNVANRWEIGVDEAGRGPMFGPLYVAGVILPKAENFRHNDMKDSKKFHSQTKIKEVAEYIKTHALAWHIQSISKEVVDEINIRQAVLRGMHECCRQCIRQITESYPDTTTATDICLLIDGNDFVPLRMYDAENETMIEIPYVSVEGVDNTYTAIAAASILAKVARDEYIAELCRQYPKLDQHYHIGKNKGYGTKQHLDGIREYGITQWHRTTFGLCKTAPLCVLVRDDVSTENL
jgi:ribonuclease HII